MTFNTEVLNVIKSFFFQFYWTANNMYKTEQHRLRLRFSKQIE